MTLDDEERARLAIQHKQERDGRIRDRIKAVLLHDKGWSLRQIAEVLLISDEAVRNHIQDYNSAKKLRPESGGSQSKLSNLQSQQLEAHLLQYTYLYVKNIVTYVEIAFGIKYTVHGLRGWLKRHLFSYKKPAVVPGKADEQQQKKWIVEYEELRAKLPPNETICFIDGVHPTHNVQPAYGWIKKGVRKEIPANSGRSRLNLSGAVDLISHKVIIQADQTLNANSTIAFFQKIEKAYPDKNKVHVLEPQLPIFEFTSVYMDLKKSLKIGSAF